MNFSQPFPLFRAAHGAIDVPDARSAATTRRMHSMTATVTKSARPGARPTRRLVGSTLASVLVLGAASAALAAAPAPPPEPLPVDQAFPITAAIERGKMVLRFDVQPGHYLYRDRFELAMGGHSLASLPLPRGRMKQDPNFGRVEVYEQPMQLSVPATQGAAGAAPEVKLVYQGCSELAGVCYPPVTRTFRPQADGKAVAPVETGATSFKAMFRKQVSQ
ncbi:MAG: protein-disulfide reductase DsbD N-terminal domain-containing protein [Burkholderiales bacterium]|nr:protein-disulfide reductase DsbD N-terminal domain-containing protein [Burkholderiales bacterium]